MNNNESINLSELLIELGKVVDPVIKEVLNLELPSRFSKLINYQAVAGGKRLRPAFLLISCRLLGGKIKDAVYPAAGVEILHNYTLIIDDIIDDSKIRRGKSTVWNKFGISAAECVGLFYAPSIFEAARISNNPTLISKMMAKALKDVAVGELMDILCERGDQKNEPYINDNRYLSVSKKIYLDMIRKKTASLFSASCQIGGICAGGKKSEIDLLGRYGLNLGMAFQIQDDILDIFGDEKSFGKIIGKDIMERKGGNIVILSALEEMKPKERKELSKILIKKRISNNDIKKAVSLIEATGAKKKSHRMGVSYVRNAKKVLEKLPQNRWNNTLKILADFVVERKK